MAELNTFSSPFPGVLQVFYTDLSRNKATIPSEGSLHPAQALTSHISTQGSCQGSPAPLSSVPRSSCDLWGLCTLCAEGKECPRKAGTALQCPSGTVTCRSTAEHLAPGTAEMPPCPQPGITSACSWHGAAPTWAEGKSHFKASSVSVCVQINPFFFPPHFPQGKCSPAAVPNPSRAG